MRAGAFDRRATMLRKTTLSDGAGGEQGLTWGVGWTRSARLEFGSVSSAAEQVRAGALAPLSRATATLRRDAATRDLATDDRLSIDGVDWNVSEIQDRPREGLIVVALSVGDAL